MAKSIYENILKVKKQALENARLKLLLSQNNKLKVEEELKQKEEELLTLLSFKPTNTADLYMLSSGTQDLLSVKRVLEEKVKLFEKEIVHFKHLYKLANIDYEKIKHLYEEDLKEQKIALEKKQALELDEIATMLFKK